MKDLSARLSQRSRRGVPIGSEMLRQRVAVELAAAPTRTSRGWVIALATAAAVFVLIGGLAVVFGGSEGATPPADDGASPTVLPTTTTTVSQVVPAPSTGIEATARSDGEPFDFAIHDLCAWFAAEEILDVAASAYAVHALDGPVPDHLIASDTDPSGEGRKGCRWTAGPSWNGSEFVVALWDESGDPSAASTAEYILVEDPAQQPEGLVMVGEDRLHYVGNGEVFLPVSFVHLPNGAAGAPVGDDELMIAAEQLDAAMWSRIYEDLNWFEPPERLFWDPNLHDLCGLVDPADIGAIVEQAIAVEGARYSIPETLVPDRNNLQTGNGCEWTVPGTEPTDGERSDFTVSLYHTSDVPSSTSDGYLIEEALLEIWAGGAVEPLGSEGLHDMLILLPSDEPALRVLWQGAGSRLFRFRLDLAAADRGAAGEPIDAYGDPQLLRVQVRVLNELLDDLGWFEDQIGASERDTDAVFDFGDTAAGEDYGSWDLASWFSSEEITLIVQEAYAIHGVESVPSAYSFGSCGASESAEEVVAGCDWIWSSTDEYFESIVEFGSWERGPALERTFEFSSHPAIDNRIEFSDTHGASDPYEWDLSVQVDGYDRLLSFWYRSPTDVPEDKSELIALTILESLVRGLGWLPVISR